MNLVPSNSTQLNNSAFGPSLPGKGGRLKTGGDGCVFLRVFGRVVLYIT